MSSKVALHPGEFLKDLILFCFVEILIAIANSSAIPGINFFIKHAGTIFRHLFQVAIKDVKQRSVDGNRLLEICPGLENHLTDKFDEMVWTLMTNAADKTHVSLEPWYSCLKTNLPNFHPTEEDTDDEDTFRIHGGEYVKTPCKSEIREQQMREGVVSKLTSFFQCSIDDGEAKKLLRQRGRQRAAEKRGFLAKERTSMINDDETEKIVAFAYQYIYALHEQIQVSLDFQINHYLYNAFKDNIANFSRVVSNDNWKEMIPADNSLDDSIQELKDKVASLKGSLGDVQKMQTQF